MRGYIIAAVALLLAAPGATADGVAPLESGVPGEPAAWAVAEAGTAPEAGLHPCRDPCPGPVGPGQRCTVETGSEAGIRCGDPDEPCAVLQAPDCWAVRMACAYVHYPLGRNGIDCQTQPGCCNLTALGVAGAQGAGPDGPDLAADAPMTGSVPEEQAAPDPAAALWLDADPGHDMPGEGETCANYGVKVSVAIGDSPCESCTNYGIQVTFGDCGEILQACSGSLCVTPGCRGWVEGVAPTVGPVGSSGEWACP